MANIWMSETVLPGFISRPEEASIIGRILAGYGELEMELCAYVYAATENFDLTIKCLFRVRGEENRIWRAVAMVKHHYVAAGLGDIFDSVIEDLHWCRQIRNQYAHSQWYYTEAEGLCFVDLEHTARSSSPIESVVERRFPLTLALLKQQEAFFVYVRRKFWYVAEAYRRAQQQARSPGSMLPNPIFTLPKMVVKPPKRPKRHK
jgi:hypothetical protein